MNSLTPPLSQLSREQKIKALEIIEEKKRRRAADPLKYVDRHPKQIEAHEVPHAIRALFWGNRVGKSEWGGQETSEYATEHHPHRKVVAPFEIWAACPSYDVQETTNQKKLLTYLPQGEIKRIEYIRGKIIKKIELKNGVTILFKSYEQGRDKFQGAGVRLIWFDEEPPQDIWDECFVRVEAGQQLDVILTMTAIKGMTWVYNRIYLDTNNPDLFISTAGWDDNPYLTEKQKAQMSRGLTPDAIQVRRDGKFVKRVGLVCSWWDRAKHVRHYDHLDRSWSWYELVDGGYSDPAAYLLIGVDHDNNVHVVSGFRKKGLNAKRLKEIRDAKRGGLMITQGWIDNDDPRLRDDLIEAGMFLQSVEKVAKDGASWDEYLGMKLDEFGMIQPGTGQPRLFISDSLIEYNENTGQEENWMVQEIENLVWLERSSKQGDEIVPKWDDHRRFGHHFDGMRALAYFLVSYVQDNDDDGAIDDDGIFDDEGFLR